MRDPRLAWFGPDGELAGGFASAGLAAVAEELAGPGRRFPGASDGELGGLVRALAGLESLAAGLKLGAVGELMRREGTLQAETPGGTPGRCSDSLRHELALALSCSPQSAEKTAWLAREMRVRLPGMGVLLDRGVLTAAKARAVAEVFQYLSGGDAARAEAMIAGRLAGKTHAQVVRLADEAALAVDPDLARRRREAAQRHGARVRLFREFAGTAGLSGRDLPPDQALAAMAAVVARAADYAASGAFPQTPADVLRAWAYLDKLNDVPAADRIAWAAARDDGEADAEAEALARLRAALAKQHDDDNPGDNGPRGDGPRGDGPGCGDPGAPGDDPGPDGPSDDSPGYDGPDYDDPGYEDPYGPGDDGPSDSPDDGPGDSPGGGGPGGGSPSGSRGCGGPGSGPGTPPPPARPSGEGTAGPAGGGSPPRPADFTVPLRTLLGLAAQPGEIHGFGLLDPALARELAAAAAASTRTGICLVITSAEGYAIAHGCARPNPPPTRTTRASGRTGTSWAPGAPSLVQFPARMVLTIPVTTLPALTNPASRAGPGNPWNLTPRPGTGPPGSSHGTWTLTLPSGRQLTVPLEPVPTLECDHRCETRAYQPGTRLRHLVQIRDWTCTFPTCNRHARDSDFEHAVPYDQGGRTCTCNAGARSRSCHRVKQSPGWKLTQPRPGWHQWTTPGGWTHTREPWRYTA